MNAPISRGTGAIPDGVYRAFRELGRAVRTITLLRYLSEPELREGTTRITNRVDSTTVDLTTTANTLLAEGWSIDLDDLATVTPYITTTVRRLGDWVLDLNPPAETVDGHLALAAAAAG